MNGHRETLLLWSPRILGVLVCLFLSVFALDAFTGEATFLQELSGFILHLAPMIVMLIIVVISWRREWLGALVFTSLAAGYAYFARGHVMWIPFIGGPLLAVGLLYLWCWVHRRRLSAHP